MTEGKKSSILWLTIDSVRFDHTPFGDSDRDTLPKFADLVDEMGLSFDNCFSHGIFTKPSSASILSGKNPFTHGVGIFNQVLPAEIDTVGERLQGAGYSTACVSNMSNVSSATYIDRGFEEFRSDVVEKSKPRLAIENAVPLGKHCLRSARHPGRMRWTSLEEGAEALISNSVIKSLVNKYQQSTQPFFIYGHYVSPHLPYIPPVYYQNSFIDEIEYSLSEAIALVKRIYGSRDAMYQTIADGCNLSAADWEAIKALYDAELRYLDEYLTDLVNFCLDQCGDNLTIVITSDHGDLFGEYDLIGHKFLLHDALTHVPMVVLGEDSFKETTEGLVQHIDVMQTLLELSGADTDGFHGVDLRSNRREAVFFQRGEYDFEPYLKYNRSFDTSRFHRGKTAAVRTDSYKYTESEDMSNLYRLPKEETDVTDSHPTVASELKQCLDDWRASQVQPVHSDKEADFSNSMITQLKDLGYVQ